MKIRFTPNEDGTATTVRIPRTDEVFDPKDGKLYSEAAVETDTLIAIVENFLDNATPKAAKGK